MQKYEIYAVDLHNLDSSTRKLTSEVVLLNSEALSGQLLPSLDQGTVKKQSTHMPLHKNKNLQFNSVDIRSIYLLCNYTGRSDLNDYLFGFLNLK